MRKIIKTHYAWYIFVACCFMAITVTGLILSTVGLFFSYIASDLNLSMTQTAGTITGMNLAIALSMPFANKIIRRLNIKVTLTACALLCGGGFMLSATFQSFLPFLVLWIVIGLATPLLMGLLIPILLGNWFIRKTGIVMGIVSGAAGVGGAFFNLIISRLLNAFGWRISYIFSGVLVLLLLLPFTLFVIRLKPGDGEYPYGYDAQEAHKTKDTKPNDKIGKATHGVFLHFPFFLILAANILATMVTGFQQLIPSHLTSSGYAIVMGGNVMSAAMLGLAAGNILMGILLDFIGPPLAMAIGCVAGAVGWVGIALTPPQLLLLASALLIGFGQSVVQIGIPYTIRAMYGNSAFADVYGVIGGLGGFACALSALIGGIVFDIFGSYYFLLLILAFFYLLSASFAVCGYLSVKRSNTKEMV